MDYSNAIDEKPDPRDQAQLVTFAVFAYNQEKLIREAVESAFAQTYEPLEIVLSDDCSTDRTFEIICEMAAAYEGPHTVRVVQNPRNMGLLGHGIARGKDAAGEIVVVAAGDDISEPERTAMLVDAFGAGENVGAVFSWVSIIDESGEVVGSAKEHMASTMWGRGRGRGLFLRDYHRNAMVRGCSAAYKKWVFEVPVSSAEGNCAEDAIFSFYLNIVGADVVNLGSPLVRYRSHSNSTVNFFEPSLSENEKQRHRYAAAQLAYLEELEGVANALDRADLLDHMELDRMRRFLMDIRDWPELNLAERVKRTLLADYRGSWKASLKRAVWRAVRSWGRYPNYQPKKFISNFQRKYS